MPQKYRLEVGRIYLQANLTKPRYLHSLDVCAEMELMAPLYGLDRHHAMFAGLMHDLCKEAPISDLRGLVRMHDPEWWELLPEACRTEIYLHDAAGAIVIRRLFPDVAPEIVDAMRRHTLNDPDMPLLNRVLRVADMVKPVSEYTGRDRLQDAFHSGEIDRANLLLDELGYGYCLRHSLTVPPILIELHEKLKMRVQGAA